MQDWRNFADANAQAIAEGMNNLNAVTIKREIPEFTGELDDGVTIDEWLKIANRVAQTAGWTNDQKLRYFQDRFTKSAANFNETLTAQQTDTFDHWVTAVTNGFQDSTFKALRKAQLKHLKQKHNERIRDFRKRIDDTYRVAYGEAVANSADAQVTMLRNEIKKEILLNGVRPEIAAVIWGRLRPNSDYEASVTTAIECEQIIEIRRVSDIVNTPTVLIPDKKQAEGDELKQIVQQLANLKLNEGKGTVAHISSGYQTKRYSRENRSQDRYRNRSESPGFYRDQSYKTGNRFSNRNHVRFAENSRGRSHSPGQFQANGTVGRRYDNQRSPVQDSNSPNGDFGKEIRTCYFCRNKGHIKRECRKFSMWKDSKGIGRPKQRQN